MINKEVAGIAAILIVVSSVMAWACSVINNLGGTIYFGVISILLALFFGWIILTTKPKEEFVKGGLDE